MKILKFNVFSFLNKSKKTSVSLLLLCPTFLYPMSACGDTTRFLGMWVVDSSHGNTVARVLPGRCKFVKRWPVLGYKRFGELGSTALVYIFQTLIVDIKYCLGHAQCSHLYAAFEKNGTYHFGPVSIFLCINDMRRFLTVAFPWKITQFNLQK